MVQCFNGEISLVTGYDEHGEGEHELKDACLGIICEDMSSKKNSCFLVQLDIQP